MITGVVYHGTAKRFEINEMQRPARFTSNPRIAKWFMFHQIPAPGAKPHMISARMQADKVYEIDWLWESWGGGFIPDDDALFEEFVQYASDGDEEEIAYWTENGFATDMFSWMMHEKGYDLIICRNVREECGMTGDMYFAFENVRILPEKE